MRLPSAYREESAIVANLLTRLDGRLDWRRVVPVAREWVHAVREHPAPFWAMERLLHEYPISGAEGLALMRLAEALSRVPDMETAIALTADQLDRADFTSAHGAHASLLGHVSDAALALARHLMPEQGEHQGLWSRLGARSVVAASMRAVQLLGHQFVLGENMVAALRAAASARERTPGVRFSYDMLGEGARSDEDARRYFTHYSAAMGCIAAQRGGGCEQRDGISIKLSALHPRYEWAQSTRVMEELLPRVWQLCEQAAKADINLTMDAEEVDRLEISLDLFEALVARIARIHPQWHGFGLAMQAYQTRAPDLVEHVIGIARKHGVRLMCRLVKGAYWDSEIKRAQELGVAHYPVFTHKPHTDVSYLACAAALLDAPDAIFPQFATHNAGTIAAILQMAESAGARFELQRLHGMGEGIYGELYRSRSIACRVYAPVGAHRDLLAYLVRRLLENGANASFVHQLADEEVDIGMLLRSPLELREHWPERHNLPVPPDLYGEGRRNAQGVDPAEETVRVRLLAAYGVLTQDHVDEATPARIEEAMEQARAAFPAWSSLPVGERPAVLRRAADSLEAGWPHFCALIVSEARRTWSDAIAEVREAVDFLRYYAAEAERVMVPTSLPGPTGERNELRLRARGVWICISPWNFPLAIFTGQVAAALVTGNVVLAKPAEQTPRIAHEMVRLLHVAGVPTDALQMLHGKGETVGAALVAHEDVDGVVFTGSTQVAKRIQRALAAKEGAIVPLIAETGGVNAMIVDSSALPEQVVDAVVHSAFRSAGQRCSALRLLCVHEQIAERVIALVVGAARELRVGDPADFATDVGPLIDAEACANVTGQIEALSARVVTLYAPHAPAGFVAPQVFELRAVEDLRQEIFGPVLCVVRWAGDPAAVVEAINALGYGLTMGVQTRIDRRAAVLAAQARAGNVYVNRGMTGAVVGVQPFGGEGLSGTGPKAGGPNYLPRFCSEQVVSVNTAAAGGNASLLVGKR